jgi:YbbR domain-containing protein
VNKINLPMALMSLFISVLLWANIYNFSKNPTKTDTITLPLQVVKLDESKYVVREIPSEVSVTVAGTRDQIATSTGQSPSAIVDLSLASAGTRNYTVIVFPPAMRQLLVNSSLTARLRVEQMQSREIPVTVKRIGGNGSKEGFEIDTFPRTVYVNGPADLIRRVNTVQVTTEFSGTAATPAGAEIQPLAVDSEGKPVSKVLFTATNSKPEYNEVKLGEPFLVRVRIKPAAMVGLP